VDELGVADVAPLELPEVVESLADSEVELGLAPLSADRLQLSVPKARRAVRTVELTVRVIFRVFIEFIFRWNFFVCPTNRCRTNSSCPTD